MNFLLKKLLFTSITCYAYVFACASNNDNVHFEYVIQNPKFYGVDSARAWFEIVGMKDKAVQAKINDTLRKAFCAPTQFKEKVNLDPMIGNVPKLPGTTEYYFYNGSTYGFGWVRFFDCDRTLRVTNADGYYASGVNLLGYSAGVAPDKIAYIRINGAARYGPRGRSEFTFSLLSGNCLPSTYVIHLDPSKRDSLEAVLLSMVRYEPYPGEIGVHDCKLVKIEPLVDSVKITSLMLIAWYNQTIDHMILISRNFRLGCLNSAEEPYSKVFASSLWFRDAIPFFKQDEWQTLLEVYK